MSHDIGKLQQVSSQESNGEKVTSLDLEIKDAQLIFRQIWADLIKKFGKENLRFPREIIWLGGAPGSGKGTNTPFIMKTRGITASPIVISKLLTSPEAKRIKDSGGMVGDREVISLLFDQLLQPVYEPGVVVDGFPRTKVQVECLKLFYYNVIELREEYIKTASGKYFKKPLFHLALLFVDEKVSVQRQLNRGRNVRAHNAKVKASGVGELLEERATDYSQEAARKRYRVFKETTYEALQSLRKIFHYHFIDASAPVEEVQQNILSELQYQSSLELDQSTFDRIRNIPLASQIIQHARQELVERLDGYEKSHSKLFQQVVSLIENKFMPIIKRHAISGLALINSEDPVFDEGLALAMLIDIFSERGYQVVVDVNKMDVPQKIIPETNIIECAVKHVYRIQVRFESSKIRRGLYFNESFVNHGM